MELTRHLIAFLIGLAVSAAVTPLVRRLAFHFNICAYPAKDRWYSRAVPLLGGVAIAAGLAAGVAVAAPDRRLVPRSGPRAGTRCGSGIDGWTGGRPRATGPS